LIHALAKNPPLAPSAGEFLNRFRPYGHLTSVVSANATGAIAEGFVLRGSAIAHVICYFVAPALDAFGEYHERPFVPASAHRI